MPGSVSSVRPDPAGRSDSGTINGGSEADPEPAGAGRTVTPVCGGVLSTDALGRPLTDATLTIRPSASPVGAHGPGSHTLHRMPGGAAKRRQHPQAKRAGTGRSFPARQSHVCMITTVSV